MKTLYKWLIGIFIGFIFLIIILPTPKNVTSDDISKEKPNENVETNYKPDSITACVMTQSFVEKSLKAPSSAKFQPCGGYDKARVTYQGNRTYFVHSYVDSQNGFGAMLRNYYSVEIKDVGFDKWQLLDIAFYD